MADNSVSNSGGLCSSVIHILSFALFIYVAIAYTNVVQPNANLIDGFSVISTILQWLNDFAVFLFIYTGTSLIIIIGLTTSVSSSNEIAITIFGVLYVIVLIASFCVDSWFISRGLNVTHMVGSDCVVNVLNDTITQTNTCHLYNVWFFPIFTMFEVLYGFMLLQLLFYLWLKLISFIKNQNDF